MPTGADHPPPEPCFLSATTVFVVDDDVSFLKSVTRLLQASGLLVKAFSSATDFLAQRPAHSPGCVVADLQMAGMNGMELQAILAKTNNPLPIVFLTGRGDVPTSVEAMRHGAEDFLSKLAPKEELFAAVRRALIRDAQGREARVRRRELRARFDRLTLRERQVLGHVLDGAKNRQIGSVLAIDERSVKRHRTSLMAKLRVQSVAELVHLANEADWEQSGVRSQETGPGPGIRSHESAIRSRCSGES
jgi:two-component system, LuxR family, response regulator FixJ